MRQQPINLIGGFYADETRHWSVQDTVNWLPVIAEQPGTRTPTKLIDAPGLRAYQQIGTGPVRGMYDCEGRRFIVSGRTLYQVTAKGVGIPLGTIPGVGRVSISHNQFKGGNQLLVCNGQPGGGYVYDTTTKDFGRISDAGFPGAISVDYMDSYLLGVEPAGRFWFHSNLADAKDYNTLDRYEAESAPDRIVGLAVSQFEVVVFGERTAEFFGNTGAATGTFQSKRAAIDRGCASRHTIAKLDNSVFWLGDDGIVYRLDGYSARRVSTVPLERAIADNKLADAFAFAWEDKGHKVYYLTFPDGQTWGYDVVCGLWHRRQSYGLKRWRLNDAVKWGRDWYGGDFQNGKLWRLDWEYPAEGDQPLVRERASPVMSDNQSAFTVPSVELIFETGQEPVDLAKADDDGGGGWFPPQPVGPTIQGDAPDGIIGEAYEPYAYVVTAGSNPIDSIHVTSGALPPGASLSNGGLLSVPIPSVTGRYTFTITVTDTAGLSATLTDAILISSSSVASRILLKAIEWFDAPETSGAAQLTGRHAEYVAPLVVSGDGSFSRSVGESPTGSSLEFNGAPAVGAGAEGSAFLTPYAGEMDHGAGAYSAACLVRRASANPSGAYHVVGIMKTPSRFNNGPTGAVLGVGYRGTDDSWIGYAAKNKFGVSHDILSTPTGEWELIVLTRENTADVSILGCSVNGAAPSLSSGTGTPEKGAWAFGIGAAPGRQAVAEFNAALTSGVEVAYCAWFYGALDAEEIAYLYNGGSYRSYDDLVAEGSIE